MVCLGHVSDSRKNQYFAIFSMSIEIQGAWEIPLESPEKAAHFMFWSFFFSKSKINISQQPTKRLDWLLLSICSCHLTTIIFCYNSQIMSALSTTSGGCSLLLYPSVVLLSFSIIAIFINFSQLPFQPLITWSGATPGICSLSDQLNMLMEDICISWTVVNSNTKPCYAWIIVRS